MLRYILIVVAAGLLAGLVWAESTGNNWLALIQDAIVYPIRDNRVAPAQGLA